MTDILLIITIVLLLISVLLTFITLSRLKNPANLQKISDSLAMFGTDLGRISASLNDEFQRNREESQKTARDNRTEMNNSLGLINDRLSKNISDESVRTENRLETMRKTIETKLTEIQTGNDTRLEQMRKTVDEKLQETLNKRISESFKMVTDQLEQVYKGLGDMQKLATGVGDLKKVLSNVKTRGIIGEIQLGKILEEYLTADQYVRNIRIKQGNRENVEYAIKLPGNENPDEPVLLPVDSKFPTEDYQRLLEIYENIVNYSKDDVAKAEKAFDASVLRAAKDIQQKYISPPVTTNFAIMFVPTEGLYAQILSRPGLFEQLQRQVNITVVGPSNLAAFMSSLQMGFRTLAVQKQSNEVWKILAAVKTEFSTFEKALQTAQKQIESASENIDKLVGVRTRMIQKKLRNVQELPASESAKLLDADNADQDSDQPGNDDDSESNEANIN
jgi:DNA recombination protein RmuC